MNPDLYCVSCWRFMRPGRRTVTPALSQLLLTERPPPHPPPPLSPSHIHNPCSNDIPISAPTLSHCNLWPLNTHTHTPPGLSLLVSRTQTAALTACDKCSWICCCPSLRTWAFSSAPSPLPEASLPPLPEPNKARPRSVHEGWSSEGLKKDTTKGWTCHSRRRACVLRSCGGHDLSYVKTHDEAENFEHQRPHLSIYGSLTACQSSCWNKILLQCKPERSLMTFSAFEKIVSTDKCNRAR